MSPDPVICGICARDGMVEIVTRQGLTQPHILKLTVDEAVWHARRVLDAAHSVMQQQGK